jgi:hypothetical protein
VTGLANKTVAFVWDHLFRGDEMFDLIRCSLASRFEGVRFVRHEEFGNVHGPDEREVVRALPEKLRALGVDAAVVAVGA